MRTTMSLLSVCLMALFYMVGSGVTDMVEAAAGKSGEVRYRSHIKSVFEARCSMCHGADSPEYREFKEDKERYKAAMKGPRMDTYPHLIYFVGWPDTGALMRRLDDGTSTKSSKPGNMYQYLGDTDTERQQNLKLFKEWVGYWALKRWKAITKEELDQIRVQY